MFTPQRGLDPANERRGHEEQTNNRALCFVLWKMLSRDYVPLKESVRLDSRQHRSVCILRNIGSVALDMR